MSLFGAVLEGAVLQPLPDTGAEIFVAAANSTTAALAPIVAVGASVTVASAVNARTDLYAPDVVAGVQVAVSNTNDTITTNDTPTVATSAQVTLSSAVDSTAASNDPEVATGTGVSPSAPVDTTAVSNAPNVVAGVLVAPATADSASAAQAPAVLCGVLISPQTANAETNSLAPALVGAGTTVFPITAAVVTRLFDSGDVGSAAVLEFAVFEGAPSTHDFTVLTSAESYSTPPLILTGKNVIPIAAANSDAVSHVPDIETERRRRMVQAVAA